MEGILTHELWASFSWEDSNWILSLGRSWIKVDHDRGESQPESIRTDAGFPFAGKPTRPEPSGTNSVTDPRVLQFDRVGFQELRSTAL